MKYQIGRLLFFQIQVQAEKEIKVGDFYSRPLQKKNRTSDNVMTISRSNIMNELSERLDFTEEEISEIKNRIPKPREDFRRETKGEGS